MMKKIALYVLCALVVVGSVVPAFATETKAVAIDDTGTADLGTATVLPESSMAVSGSSAVSPSYTYNYNLDGATVGLESGTTVGLEEGTEVTLSDESVEALADAIVTKQTEAAAVSESGYTYVFTNKLGSSIELTFSEYLNSLYIDNPYILILQLNASTVSLIFSTDELAWNGSYVTAYDGSKFYYLGNKAISALSGLVEGDATFRDEVGIGTTYKSKIAYCNYDVYDDGSLLYASDVLKTYTVFFNTGFDGLSYESQEWTEDFDPGTLSYDGYTFAGWYMDADFTTPYSSDYVPEADFTLYARWIENGPMDLFHNSLFRALDALFACEPIRYIFALIFLVIIVGLFKSRRSL